MASHVFICMSIEKSIKGEGNQFIEEESNKKERKEKKREEKKREKNNKGREKEGEKEIGVSMVGNRCSDSRKSAFRRSELVGPRSKVRIFNEGYTPRVKDHHKGCGVVSFP